MPRRLHQRAARRAAQRSASTSRASSSRSTGRCRARARSGHGTAVPITADTGYFWFFNSDNVELVIKVLDGQALNGHFWVFYGALTNVEYTITVTDTVNGLVKTYTNPSGQLASVGDTTAFPPAPWDY